jgi:hypothetical protein
MHLLWPLDRVGMLVSFVMSTNVIVPSNMEPETVVISDSGRVDARSVYDIFLHDPLHHRPCQWKRENQGLACLANTHPIHPKSTIYITTLGYITSGSKSLRKGRVSCTIDLIDLYHLLEGSCSGKGDELWLRIEFL